MAVPALISAQTLEQINPWAGTYRNLNFGKFESECPTWRYELAAQPDGQVEFRLIEPGSYRRWSEGKDADRAYHFLLGKPPCQYRMTFQLNR
jgi:hypothetical protein